MRRRTVLQLGLGGLGANSLRRLGMSAVLPLPPGPGETSGKLRPSLDLAGEWRFQMDPLDVGGLEHWYKKPEKLQGTIMVPGCWQAQGYGEPTGNFTHHYLGPVWYGKEINVPPEWEGKTIELVIGGAFVYTTAYVNGAQIGQDAALTVPYRFDVTSSIKPGEQNVICLRIANGKKIETHVNLAEADFSEPTGCGNFARLGGLYRTVGLEAHAPASMEAVAITTNVPSRTASFRVRVGNKSGSALESGRVEVQVSLPGEPQGESQTWQQSQALALLAGASQEVELQLEIPQGKLWSPDEPNLYHARLLLYDGDKPIDEVEENFGIREIRVEGTKLLLNGQPLYFLGYGDDSDYVLDGIPLASKEVHLERLRIAKSFGFNGVRYHSWTPAEEFFQAADELGLLIMAELPVVYQNYLLPNKEFLKSELTRIIATHRNHPSWMSLALGNEFNQYRIHDMESRTTFLQAIRELVELGKRLDPTRPLLSNEGYMVEPTDLASLYTGYSPTRATIKHEFGVYYCSLPDIYVIGKFTGVTKPKWLQDKKDWLQSQGLLDRYPDYLHHSWRLLNVARKAEIESLRRLEEITGYQYWLITDLADDGTTEGPSWEWGWCNYFWEPKGVTPEQGQEINAAMLPLVGLKVSDRTMWAEESKRVDVFVSNYGPGTIADGVLEWELRSGPQRLIGDSYKVHAPLGAVTRVGQIQIEKIKAPEARELDLRITVSGQSQTHTNRWKIWAFPRQGLMQNSPRPVFSLVKSSRLTSYFPFIQNLGPQDDPSGGVLVTSELSTQVVAALEKGGRVLVLADQVRSDQQSPATYFPPPGGALGIKIQDHPALKGFPHDGFPDLQFYNLLEGGSQFRSEGLEDPTFSFVPVISGLNMTRERDTNALAYFALLFEAKVGAGKLLLTTLNIRQNLDDAFPEAIYLFDRLLRYAASDEFNPPGELSQEHLRDLVVPYVHRVHSL